MNSPHVAAVKWLGCYDRGRTRVTWLPGIVQRDGMPPMVAATDWRPSTAEPSVAASTSPRGVRHEPDSSLIC
jgi:hypothetical protein